MSDPHMTDIDLPPAYRTQANFWCAEYLKAMQEIAKANKGIRRLKNGRRKESAYIRELERLLVFVEGALQHDGTNQNAPGHHHRIPGRWDSDGRICDGCKAWTEIQGIVKTINERTK